MSNARPSVAILLVMALGITTSACGDEEEEETPALGTCDRRSVAGYCIELHEPSAADFENQEEGCIEADGDWSTDPCPSDELIGCCVYVRTNDFRQCYYTGYTGDPEGVCTSMLDGAWTQAS